jgi:hypothetical protein
MEYRLYNERTARGSGPFAVTREESREGGSLRPEMTVAVKIPRTAGEASMTTFPQIRAIWL